MGKFFSFDKNFGLIVPDGIDMDNHSRADVFFCNRNAIRNVGGRPPGLQEGQRVEFRTAPPYDGKVSPRALDITMEGGALVPQFMPGYLDQCIRRHKAMFGDKVYEIMSTSTDQQEMETRIVEAFDDVKERIEKTEAKVKLEEDRREDVEDR